MYQCSTLSKYLRNITMLAMVSGHADYSTLVSGSHVFMHLHQFSGTAIMGNIIEVKYSWYFHSC